MKKETLSNQIPKKEKNKLEKSLEALDFLSLGLKTAMKNRST